MTLVAILCDLRKCTVVNFDKPRDCYKKPVFALILLERSLHEVHHISDSSVDGMGDGTLPVVAGSAVSYRIAFNPAVN